MSATLDDIARVFGVSKMTVSNAINKKPGVSEDKSQAIREYVSQIGYRPSRLPKVMSSRKTNIIGMCLLRSTEDPWYGTLQYKLHNEFQKKGFHLNVLFATEGADPEKWALDYFNELRVDATIIGPIVTIEEYMKMENNLKGHKHPIVFGAVDTMPISHIRINEYKGGRMAALKLIEMGHNKIGMIGFKAILGGKYNLTQNRFRGFWDVLIEKNIPIRKEWFLEIDNLSDVHPEQKIKKFLNSDLEKPTAWFIQNDTMAVNSLKTFSELGYNIPEDISIIGFDNHPISTMVSPNITTIDYPIEDYCEALVKTTISHIENKNFNKTPIIIHQIEPIFIERESILPPRNTGK